ncbi:MAG: hypothetical protein DMF56_26945 [Acidobacteria bacterium]|nr:MAG: hypothetical protein DMF56_26945 [Acidobacteriota bacterium]
MIQAIVQFIGASAKSRTIRANVVALGIALYQHFYGNILPADPQWYMLSLAVINIVLRFKTTQPLQLRATQPVAQ